MERTETFGSRLAGFRKMRGLTQEDLAERLHLSPQAVSKWENDLTSPDLDTLAQLAEIFNISTDELLGRIKKEAHLVEAGKQKDFSQMLLRIQVNSHEGDKVNVNLPLVIVKGLVDSGAVGNLMGGKYSLDSVDWNQMLGLIEQGVVGELVSVQSADGDTVSIRVE